MRRDFTLPEDRLTPDLQRRLAAFSAIAARRGDTPAALALRWVLAQEGVTSVIVGASSIAQLADNLNCTSGTPLSEEEMNELGSI